MPIEIQTKLSSYLSRVFAWMVLAMALSGIASFLVYSSETLQNIIFSSPIVFYSIIIGEFIVVGTLSARIQKMSPAVAFGLFALYSILTGLTLSVILFAYAPKMLVGAFLMASSVYGIMAVIGYTTKVNLSGLRVFFTMAIIGIIVASIANIFLKLTGLSLVLNYVTLIVFSGLTAYDMQRIRANNEQGYIENKYAIVDALGMYINFINIFISILNILNSGKR
jgi:uncharacterized protein